MCPNCLRQTNIVKFGFFRSARRRIQRFKCKACLRTFSTQTLALTYREKKPRLNAMIFVALNSGVSQRRCAEICRTNRITIARKIVRMGRQARAALRVQNEAIKMGSTFVFDEMETSEHTKMKPLSIALAVEEGTRRIVAVEVASMPAKGHLAAKSRLKYGYRPDHRAEALAGVCREIKRANPQVTTVKSDECPRYPVIVARHLPGVTHLTYKGRRACVVGQGELKALGRDPIFSLNHTAAMNRDNLKTLSRRTWCTTKRPDRLQYLLYLYAWCHNQRLTGTRIRDVGLPPYTLR